MRCKQVALTTFVFFIFSLFAVSAITLFSAPGLYGQDVDLVKLKKEEEERKKKTKKSKYKVTNENLGKIDVPKKPYSIIKLGEGKGAAGASGSSIPVGSGGEGAQDDSVGDSKEDKTKPEYWQGKVTKLLDEMDKTKKNINEMQTEFNQLANTWSAEDILQKREEKRKRVEDLRKLIPEEEQKLEKLKQDMADLEEDARKNNIPAGWLRVARTGPPTPQKQKQRDQQE